MWRFHSFCFSISHFFFFSFNVAFFLTSFQRKMTSLPFSYFYTYVQESWKKVMHWYRSGCSLLICCLSFSHKSLHFLLIFFSFLFLFSHFDWEDEAEDPSASLSSTSQHLLRTLVSMDNQIRFFLFYDLHCISFSSSFMSCSLLCFHREIRHQGGWCPLHPVLYSEGESLVWSLSPQCDRSKGISFFSLLSSSLFVINSD